MRAPEFPVGVADGAVEEVPLVALVGTGAEVAEGLLLV